MKKRHSYLDRSARRALAIVFACLFIFQAVGFFHVAAAIAGPAQPGSVADSSRGSVVVSIGEHCNRLAHDGAPGSGQCDHSGFCAFCSASDREAASFDAPPPSSLISILLPADEPAGRFIRGFERSTQLPTSSGLDESRFSTAPPRA